MRKKCYVKKRTELNLNCNLNEVDHEYENPNAIAWNDERVYAEVNPPLNEQQSPGDYELTPCPAYGTTTSAHTQSTFTDN